MASDCMMWLEWLLGWPLIVLVIAASVICTVAFNFVQIRYFLASWKMIFSPSEADSKRDMSPLSAFLNTLNANLGNGSIVGGAMAVALGGPGAVFWMVAIGIMLMAVRFAEVYASALYGANAPKNTVLGGPMLYLRDVCGGRVLAPLYAIICSVYSIVLANTLQTNAISSQLFTTWGVNNYVSAVLAGLLIGYVVFGGAKRIIEVSDRIVPIKVLVFVCSVVMVLAYHVSALPTAFMLIYQSAFNPIALAGGVFGFGMMHAMREGMNTVVTATESGLGTAAILFGFTGSKNPMNSAVISMVSTFLSSIACSTIGLCVVVSGVWNSGIIGAPLTSAAFQTVFGMYGGWVVTFLSTSFGIGVLVAYAYIARATWLYLTNGRFEWLFSILYCAAAFMGAIIDIRYIWALVLPGNGLLLLINLYGILSLIGMIRRHMRATNEGHA